MKAVSVGMFEADHAMKQGFTAPVMGKVYQCKASLLTVTI
jgi:hypothetical protein